MADIIIGGILIVLVGAAIAYIVREKKRGVVCIGCPAAGTCSSRNHPEGAGCSCSMNMDAVEAELREAVRDCRGERES